MPDSNITDLSVSILRDIRDRLDGTNERLDTLNERVDGLTGEVHVLTSKVDVLTGKVDILSERVLLVEQTVKVAADKIGAVVRIVKNRHETALDDLRERVTRLEVKASGGGT